MIVIKMSNYSSSSSSSSISNPSQNGSTFTSTNGSASNNYTDAMIDIETTSTKMTARICSIGIVLFNCYQPSVPLVSVECLLQEPSQDKKDKYHVCKETMEWWSRQSEQVRKLVNL